MMRCNSEKKYITWVYFIVKFLLHMFMKVYVSSDESDKQWGKTPTTIETKPLHQDGW